MSGQLDDTAPPLGLADFITIIDWQLDRGADDESSQYRLVATAREPARLVLGAQVSHVGAHLHGRDRAQLDVANVAEQVAKVLPVGGERTGADRLCGLELEETRNGFGQQKTRRSTIHLKNLQKPVFRNLRPSGMPESPYLKIGDSGS